LAAASVAVGATGPSDDSACLLGSTDVGWIQRALDRWAAVSRQFLKLDDRALPWMVLFDASCAWHLSPGPTLDPETRIIPTSLTFSGVPVQVRAKPHSGIVQLPNGAEVPIEVRASTSLYRYGRIPFFAMSMPSVWRADPHYATFARLDDLLDGVISHEMTHTRLLPPINRRIRELGRKFDLPMPLNDDVVQARFGKVQGFERAFNQERQLFYRAVLTANPIQRRDYTAAALSLGRQRRTRYFTGANEPYAEIESMFLVLEGAGQLAAYRAVARGAEADGIDAAAISLVRDNRKYWSQDEGLALFLLIDAMVPDWQSKIFTSAPASPFSLLESAIVATSM
jgi:hypothetical protein